MRAAQIKNKDRYFRGDEVGAKPEPAPATPAASTVAPVIVPNPNVETGFAPSPSEIAPGAQKIWRY
jgi:hypothetical protein